MGDAEELARANLRALLSAQGVKPAELARRLGVADSNVSQWLSGTVRLTLGRLTEIAGALGVHVSIFLAEDDVPPARAPAKRPIDPDTAALKRLAEATDHEVIETPTGELRVRKKRKRPRTN